MKKILTKPDKWKLKAYENYRDLSQLSSAVEFILHTERFVRYFADFKNDTDFACFELFVAFAFSHNMAFTILLAGDV